MSLDSLHLGAINQEEESRCFFSQGAPASAVTLANPVVYAEVHLAARVADMGEGNQLVCRKSPRSPHVVSLPGFVHLI